MVGNHLPTVGFFSFCRFWFLSTNSNSFAFSFFLSFLSFVVRILSLWDREVYPYLCCHYALSSFFDGLRRYPHLHLVDSFHPNQKWNEANKTKLFFLFYCFLHFHFFLSCKCSFLPGPISCTVHLSVSGYITDINKLDYMYMCYHKFLSFKCDSIEGKEIKLFFCCK